MKTLKLFSSFFSLVLISLAAMSFTSTDSADLNTAGAYSLFPDLKISQIATPDGLCKGNQSKVRVSITNPQMMGVAVQIPVILNVIQQGEQPTSYIAYLRKGIGPSTNRGQHVWFKNIVIPGEEGVTLKAEVNPDREIRESKYNNNTLTIHARVGSICPQDREEAQDGTIIEYY